LFSFGSSNFALVLGYLPFTVSNMKEFQHLEFDRGDYSSVMQQGFPAVVFGDGKTRAQTAAIFEKLVARAPNVLVTRSDGATFGELRNICNEAEWHESAKLIRVWRDKTDLGAGEIAVLAARTSDISVAEEAALTAETMGNRVNRIWDADNADINQSSPELALLNKASVIIAAIGAKGALPSVIGGIVHVPIIALPTSVGYSASFGGSAALFEMLDLSHSNVTVVNIDNGFGAGFVASLINRRRKAD
jgi:NCAIR mutase (PurE)-related protein